MSVTSFTCIIYISKNTSWPLLRDINNNSYLEEQKQIKKNSGTRIQNLNLYFKTLK